MITTEIIVIIMYVKTVRKIDSMNWMNERRLVMGYIAGKPIDFTQLVEMAEGIVKKDHYFNLVHTLEQDDLDKNSDSVFEFKFEHDGTWYLASFYRSAVTGRLTLGVSKFVD